jgi:hypothetical protein
MSMEDGILRFVRRSPRGRNYPLHLVKPGQTLTESAPFSLGHLSGAYCRVGGALAEIPISVGSA